VKSIGFSLPKLIRYIWEELLIVLATTSSEVVLPRMIAKLEDAGCEESVVGLVIPTGYSFNLDGTCLYLATAAVFLAQATNTPLAIEQQIGLLLVLLLASKGAAGVAGAAFVQTVNAEYERHAFNRDAANRRKSSGENDVRGLDADEPDRKCRCDDCGCEMGKGSGRAAASTSSRWQSQQG